MEAFQEKAIAGSIMTTATIHAAFEKNIGKKGAKSTVYRLLKQHHGRNIVPRPYHPQKDPKRPEEFKKKLPDQVKTIIREQQWDREEVLLGVQDEGRFGRMHVPKKSWCHQKYHPRCPNK